jgi:hypothetical protein
MIYDRSLSAAGRSIAGGATGAMGTFNIWRRHRVRKRLAALLARIGSATDEPGRVRIAAAKVAAPSITEHSRSPSIAPGDEIEITPAMIRAGVIALSEFDDRFEGEEEAVVDIFRAMVTAKVRRPSES